MMDHIKRNSLYWSLLKIAILPILLLALLITIFSTKRFANSMNEEVKQGLKDLCSIVLLVYDNMYEGDYHIIQKDGKEYLFKGEYQVDGHCGIIDEVKQKTGVDVTFFCQNIRAATTIKDNRGQRMTGTVASDEVTKEVLEGKKEAFYSRVSINESDYYFAYYAPLRNSDGVCVGMIFAGKSSSDVEGLVRDVVKPILWLAFFAIILSGWFTISISKKMVGAIRKIETFLSKISGGELHAKLESSVLERNDEIGEMGRHVIRMQKSLRGLIEQDLLTGLNNRRNGEMLLLKTQYNFVKSQVPYCVVIGDIDYFKRVNDTYGHECGDVVLREVAQQLKEHMEGKGFAARWGGEEFLLVYECCRLNKAVQYLEELMECIRNKRITYQKEDDIRITMTFGIVEGNEEKINHIIKNADTRLYYGKNSGRNQIVQ